MSEKNIILYRSLSHRNNNNAISWRVSPSYSGLGQIGQGSLGKSCLAAIIAAYKDGYTVGFAPSDAEMGVIEVSDTTRQRILAALQSSS